MEDSDGEDWSLPLEAPGGSSEAVSGSRNDIRFQHDRSTNVNRTPTQQNRTISSADKIADHSRVILHIDIDCFYAQVEMIRNPTLRDKPLGVQQKYIIVTCNYPARERGLGKLMLVKDALEKCPDLVLVNGEDLTHYRDMSYKISNYLQQYCPLVQRLGMDENFLDITDMVSDRLQDAGNQAEVKGHVAGNQAEVKGHVAGNQAEVKGHVAGNQAEVKGHVAGNQAEVKGHVAGNQAEVKGYVAGNQAEVKGYVAGNQAEVKGHVYGADLVTGSSVCSCGCHRRLIAGSQVAMDIRDGLRTELGITSCGGISHNKLLAKLVAGTHKPNQQTTLFPGQVQNLMLELGNARQIPGIGSATAKRLKEMGITSVLDLQIADSSDLEKEFGSVAMETMKNLSRGIDPSPVIAFGRPQSLSDEDSFKKCCSLTDARSRMRRLLISLLERLCTDRRTPHTFRLTVRKISDWYHRESRQCGIPAGVFTHFSKEKIAGVCDHLEELAVNLLSKMVDASKSFHLTLINVAFSKLEEPASNSITNFFMPKPSQNDKDANALNPSQDLKVANNDSDRLGQSKSKSADTSRVSDDTDRVHTMADLEKHKQDRVNSSDAQIKPNNLSSAKKGADDKFTHACGTIGKRRSLNDWLIKSPARTVHGSHPTHPSHIEKPSQHRHSQELGHPTHPSHIEKPSQHRHSQELGHPTHPSHIEKPSQHRHSQVLDTCQHTGQLVYTDAQNMQKIPHPHVTNKRTIDDSNEESVDSKRIKNHDCFDVNRSFSSNGALPDNIDRDVFDELPPDIQKELLENLQATPKTTNKSEPYKQLQNLQNTPKTTNKSKLYKQLQNTPKTTNKSDKDGNTISRKTVVHKQETHEGDSNIVVSKIIPIDTSEAPVDIRVMCAEKRASGNQCQSKAMCAKPSVSQKSLQAEIPQGTVQNEVSAYIEDQNNPCHQDIPPGVDQAVFLTLPSDIQQELVNEWKDRVQSQQKSTRNGPHYKMPKPSASNNILSYFSKK